MKKPLRVIIVALSLVFLAIGTAFFLRPTPGTNGDEAEKVSVRLAWIFDMAEVGLFVAEDQGSFSASGLDVTIEQGGLGLDPLKLVAAGTNDFGVAGAGNLLLARAQGVPVVAIGAEFQNTPVGFIVRADSGIRRFADFRGRRIGVQTGADTDVLFRALMARNGMTSADLREVPIQYDPTPLVAGQIDVLPGYVTNQPVTLQSNGLDVNVLSAESEGLNYYGNVYFTSERMIREHPERVRKFMQAVRLGWETALNDRSASLSAIKSRSQDFKDPELEKIYAAVMPFIRPQDGAAILNMTEERWRTTAEVLQDAGLLKGPVDISSAYTNQFLVKPNSE